MAIRSGARTSTRMGAGPLRTCVTHAGSHVTARRTNSDPLEFDPLEKVAEISRSISCTAGDLSEPPLRPPTRVPLRGTDPTHRPRAAPVTESSGTRRRRRDDAGFTSTIRSVAPALATPAANTIDSSNPSTISYEQSHGNAVCTDTGGCAVSFHAVSSRPSTSPPPALVTSASGSATTTTNLCFVFPSPAPTTSVSPRAQDASHGPCALNPHALFFSPSEPTRTGHMSPPSSSDTSVPQTPFIRRRSRPRLSSPPEPAPPHPSGNGTNLASAPSVPPTDPSIDPVHR